MEEKKERRNKKTKSVGNGEGSLYKSEKLNCYVFQYVVNGKRKTMTQRKNESKKEFKSRVTDTKNKLNNGSYIEKSKETVYEIAKKHIEQKFKDGLVSICTHNRDLQTLKEIENTCYNFCNKPIQKVNVEDIQKAKEKMRQYSNSIIGKIWTLLNKSFKLAVSRKIIIFNPMNDEFLKKPISLKKDKIIEALTIEEQKKLIEILNNEEQNHKYRNIILLQLYTGMRISEVLALSLDCIDLKNMTIHVYRSLTRDEKEKIVLGEHTKTYSIRKHLDKGERTFPLTQNAQRIIKEIYKSKISNINNLLFWDYKDDVNIKPFEVNFYLKRINDKYNISNLPLTSHVLRHTFITRCRENGIDLTVLQKIVGHVQGSLITNQVYTSVSQEFMKNEIQKII